MRAVLHGAMTIYLIRSLNVPPTRLPGDGDDRLKDLSSTVEEIRAALLHAFDRQHRVDEAAQLAARHLAFGHPPNRSMSPWRMPFCAKPQIFTHIKFWKPARVSSTSGPTQNRSGIS